MRDKLTVTAEKQIDAALDLAIEKCLRDAERLDSFPHVTQDGDWLVSDHGRWTAGFFVGMLWIAGMVRRDDKIFKVAKAWTKRLESRSFDRSTHDMGFLFEPSAVRGYNCLNEIALRDMAVQAARSLATRFHTKGHYIPAWTPEEDPSYLGLAIVDTIMNLPILIWGGRVANDPNLTAIGLKCAETIRTQHIRSDGSTYHTVDHNDENGAITTRGTHQGAHSESCWSRGQAWALHGFTKMAQMADSNDLLATARLTADYFLDQLGKRALPPWDFNCQGEDEPKDSAAGAIAASGLMELGRATDDNAYTESAQRIVLGLIDTCVDFDHPEKPGLLMHGTVDFPRRSGIDESIMYGDHFFMEALIKIRHPELWNHLGCVSGPVNYEK